MTLQWPALTTFLPSECGPWLYQDKERLEVIRGSAVRFVMHAALTGNLYSMSFFAEVSN